MGGRRALIRAQLQLLRAQLVAGAHAFVLGCATASAAPWHRADASCCRGWRRDVRTDGGKSIPSSGQVALDIEYHRTMLELHMRVNPKETIVGWYSTGADIVESDALIHVRLVCRLARTRRAPRDRLRSCSAPAASCLIACEPRIASESAQEFYTREGTAPIHVAVDTAFVNEAKAIRVRRQLSGPPMINISGTAAALASSSLCSVAFDSPTLLPSDARCSACPQTSSQAWTGVALTCGDVSLGTNFVEVRSSQQQGASACTLSKQKRRVLQMPHVLQLAAAKPRHSPSHPLPHRISTPRRFRFSCASRRLSAWGSTS